MGKRGKCQACNRGDHILRFYFKNKQRRDIENNCLFFNQVIETNFAHFGGLIQNVKKNTKFIFGNCSSIKMKMIANFQKKCKFLRSL